MSIRTALGAGRWRLIRQLLTESVVLTCCGALLGLVMALLATRAITHLTAFHIPLLASVRLDAGTLVFTVLMALVAGVVVGLAPALQVSLIPLTASLGQRGSSESARHREIRGALVIAEIAFACVLLVGAGLLMRSFIRVLDVNLGFRPQSAASLRIDPSSTYDTPARRNGYLDEALRRVRAIQGVEAAGISDGLPLGHNRTWGSPAKGQTYEKGNYPTSFVHIVSDGYLKAMGISLAKGRDFTERDSLGSTPVILVNETLAHRLWPGQDAIGKIILGDCAKEREVVGVVSDVRHMALEKGSGSEMYIPMRQCSDTPSWNLVVRARLPLLALSQSVEQSLRPMAPDLPKGGMQPLTHLVDSAVSPRRFIVFLLSGFAAFALMLASLGIYGVISYSVNRRTQEIGIRMALGATRSNVQGSIVGQTLALAAMGMVAGIAASWAVARALSGLLFGITYGDPLTFTFAAAVLLLIAALAGYLPARRAAGIDPMAALRIE